MKKRILVFIALLCILVLAFAAGVAYAVTPGVDVYLVMNNSVFKSYASDYYIYNEGIAANKFNIKNNTQEEVFYKKIIIRETLTSAIHTKVQTDTVYTNVALAANTLLTLEGNSVMFYEMSSVPYMYSYNIIATDENDMEHALLTDDKVVTLKQLYIDFDITYEILSDITRLEVEDAIQVMVKVTSRSSVEVSNVTVDIYGLGRVGVVDRIVPNETVTIENYLTVTESVDTYVTLKCNTPIIPQVNFVADYTNHSKKIDVKETKTTYSMALLTEVDNYYIERNAYTSVKLTVKNTGDGVITEIMLKDASGNNIVVAGRLAPGDEYTYVLDGYFSPGIVYEFSAIGFAEGTTKAIKALSELEFLHYNPKCEVKCEVSSEQCKYLDEIEVVYTIKNTGTIFLEDVTLNDVVTGISINVGDILPGGYKQVKYTFTAKESVSLTPVVNGVCRGFDDSVTASAKQKIIVSDAVYSSNVEMYISTEKNAVKPDEAVDLNVRIINLGDGVLKNVYVKLVEYDVLIGNIDELTSGGTKEFSMRFVPRGSGVFTVELIGTDETGKSVEISKGFDIRILDKISDDTVGNTKGATLEITILVICIILGVFALFALVITAMMLMEKLTGKTNHFVDVLRDVFNKRK